MEAQNVATSYKAVVIGGSAGSFKVMLHLLSRIPVDFPLPILMCFHRQKHVKNGFLEALATKSLKKVEEPVDKQPIENGKLYLAPANYHMGVEQGKFFSLSTEDISGNSRPSIDITLQTAAAEYRNKLIGILLTGANSDGALGMKSIKESGGLTIVQDPSECVASVMPKAAMALTKIDHVMKVEEINQFLLHVHQTKK